MFRLATTHYAIERLLFLNISLTSRFRVSFLLLNINIAIVCSWEVSCKITPLLLSGTISSS